jgi:hypothetical protein
MSRYCSAIANHPSAGTVELCFSEQSEPSLYEVFRRLRKEGYEDIMILPLLVPLEPSFLAWLSRTLQRWRAAWGDPWPRVRVGKAPVDTSAMLGVIAEMFSQSDACPELAAQPVTPGGSIVPRQKRRVLMCAGAPAMLLEPRCYGATSATSRTGRDYARPATV